MKAMLWLGRHPVRVIVVFIGINVVGNLIGYSMGGFAGGMVRFAAMLLGVYLLIAFFTGRREMRR